uniref:Uncharacterized protein n=1 Tax=Amorphochlora amoebiformis TaxID=1561963 RepID=A0A7S0DF13_9EUKA|mmetsp:Transcript_25663/g.40566  ORF Transcript_25663/g.40566 Transcript_25663/m.40566 type:complete len:152 (+) Transcript_25663:118-573(+)
MDIEPAIPPDAMPAAREALDQEGGQASGEEGGESQNAPELPNFQSEVTVEHPGQQNAEGDAKGRGAMPVEDKDGAPESAEAICYGHQHIEWYEVLHRFSCVNHVEATDQNAGEASVERQEPFYSANHLVSASVSWSHVGQAYDRRDELCVD